MKRRARGDGGVFHDKTRGVWTAIIELDRDPGTKRRTRRKASARTKTEALALRDGMRADKRTAGTVGRRDYTVAKLLEDYLDAPHAKWESDTTSKVAASHAKRITAELGQVKLANLTAAQVERFLKGQAKAGKSTSTIRQTRAPLVAAIKRAQRDKLIGSNVAAQAEAPTGTKRKPRALTLEQVFTLLDAASGDPWWSAYCHVAIMCGLRPGELLGLRWQDVDLHPRPPRVPEVRVRQSLKQAPGQEPRLDDLKTEQSRRTIRLPAAATAALEAHQAAQRKQRARLGPAWTDEGLVFPGPDGKPASRSTTAHEFAALTASAGLGPQTRYITRHTFASVLSHGGTDIEAIADAMGHANSKTTVTVYRHNLADRISVAAAAWDKLQPVGAQLGSPAEASER